MAILIIHGGAGSTPDELVQAYEDGLREALDVGYAALTEPPTSDVPRAAAAVLAAVTAMEANPVAFNAGVGGAMTRDGTVELDACIALSDGSVGAVAAVRNTPHPALLADLVRRTSKHHLLVGEGAEALVTDPVPNEALYTELNRKGLEKWRRQQESTPTRPALPGAPGSNTVGAVALDDEGNLAAATSTGGLVGQWRGRVADTPLFGVGTYADERVAVSCTGDGEAVMRALTAGRLAQALERGDEPEAALRAALDDIAAKGGRAGLIALQKSDTPGGVLMVGFTSDTMAYAIRSPELDEASVAKKASVRVFRTG